MLVYTLLRKKEEGDKKLTKKKKKKLDDASERDKRRLLDEFRISTVVDLRSVYFPPLLSPSLQNHYSTVQYIDNETAQNTEWPHKNAAKNKASTQKHSRQRFSSRTLMNISWIYRGCGVCGLI